MKSDIYRQGFEDGWRRCLDCLFKPEVRPFIDKFMKVDVENGRD